MEQETLRVHRVVLDTAAANAAMSRMTASAQAAAKAQSALAAVARTVTRAMKNMIAGFDELHIAVQDTPAAGKKGSSGRKSGSSKKKKEELLPDAPEEEAAWLQWLRSYLETDLAPAVAAWQAAFGQLRAAAQEAFGQMRESALELWQGALVPLGQYLLHDFLPALINSFSTAVAPLLADVGTALLDIFAAGFVSACGIAQQAVENLLLPALELIKTVVSDVFGAVQSVWEEMGAPLLEGLRAAFDGLFALVESVYTGIVQPVLQSLLETLGALWNEHLAPLWENLLLLLAEAGEAVLTLWNEVLQPAVLWILETFGPVLTVLGEGILSVFSSVAGTVASVISGIIDALRGLCEFLKNVFTGNWSAAWESVKNIFSSVWSTIGALLRGAVNGIISCVNAMTRGIASAVNAVVGAVNSIRFTVPDWVPGFGGSALGFHLPSVSAPQIPLLARGAVIPPNAAFMAVLGDQRHGRNLEAPETLIRQIVREESGGAQTLQAEQPVELSLDGDVFYRAMMRIRAGRGAQIGGVFADAI